MANIKATTATVTLSITFLILQFFGQFSALAQSNLNPEKISARVYAVYISKSPQCTDPITVFNYESVTEGDWIKFPVLGYGSIPDGTYECVIIKMNDNIKFSPISNGANCKQGTEYTLDLCRADPKLKMTTTGLDGKTSKCRGLVGSPAVANQEEIPAVTLQDTVYLYLTTDPAAPSIWGKTTFDSPATAAGNGFKLAEPIEISGANRFKFIINGMGKVDSNAGKICEMSEPTFGFSRL